MEILWRFPEFENLQEIGNKNYFTFRPFKAIKGKMIKFPNKINPIPDKEGGTLHSV